MKLPITVNLDARPDPFRIIYADPAWTYRDKGNAGKRGAGFKYGTMSAEAIKRLPVGDIADPTGSALFLWATYPLLPVALDVLRAWGFTFKTVAFTWVKVTKAGKRAFGMGNWTRSNPEVVLLGVRGKIRRQSAAVPNLTEALRGRHSEKPDLVRQRIVQLMGDLPRVELFARIKAPGWSAWGNEVESDIQLTNPQP